MVDAIQRAMTKLGKDAHIKGEVVYILGQVNAFKRKESAARGRVHLFAFSLSVDPIPPILLVSFIIHRRSPPTFELEDPADESDYLQSSIRTFCYLSANSMRKA